VVLLAVLQLQQEQHQLFLTQVRLLLLHQQLVMQAAAQLLIHCQEQVFHQVVEVEI
jgi:hypothetical protein